MTLYPSQDAFVRGELSPRLHSRASIELYRAGLAKCENFITMPHGGARKRGGSYFVNEVKDSSKLTIGIPFIFSDDQAYCLEVGHQYLRVYAYGARVGSVELVTPWSSIHLRDLRFVQSADELWVVHPIFTPRKIKRLGHTNWTIELAEFTDGPFGLVNTDETHKMFVDAVDGNITIESDFDVFTADMVGQLIRIEMESYETIKPWEPNQALPDDPLGELRRYSGNIYECVSTVVGNGGDINADPVVTGATAPTHTKGIEWDGTGQLDPVANHWVGVQWEYLHSGYGIARITAFTDAQEVDALVVARFPDEVVGSGNESFLWRFGAFGDRAFPESVQIFEERLMYGRRFSVYGSKTSAFDQFKTGEKDDDGLEFQNAGGGRANDIVWLADTDGFLAIGTIGGVRSLAGSGVDEVLTPSSFKNRRSRTFGCAPIIPVDAGSAFIYVTKSRQVLAEMIQNQALRFQTQDLTQVSEHITKKTVVALAFQENPDPVLWFPLENGELGSFTYQPAQEVRGAHRQRLGGSATESDWALVEHVVVTPGQAGVDDVWLFVKRTINGATHRYIEILQAPFEYGDLEDAFCVDCGLSRPSGAAVNAVSGMVHLAGETVDILADGKVYKGRTVSNAGTLSLPNGATAVKWHVGLPYVAEAATLELDVGGRDGSLLGRRKKVSAVILSLFETDTTNLEIASMTKNRWEPVRIESVVPKPTDGSANLFTGNVRVLVDDSWSGMGQIRLRHSGPTPCTIRAATPVFASEP